MTFQQVFRILLARWFVVLGVFGAVLAAAVVITLFSPRRYTSTALVMIDPKNDPVAGTNNQQQQIVPGYISTQVDIAASLRVAQRVVKTIGMDKAPEARRQWQQATGGVGDLTSWQADGLRAGLTVSPSRESTVINIGMTWSDPQMAARLANAFAQAYIDTSIELRVEPARQYAAWFDERSRDLRVDLEAKQKKLSEYQRDNGILGIDDRLDIENQRLAQLSQQLLAVQSARQDSQSRQLQANGSTEAMSEVLQSPIVSSLRTDLLKAEARQEDIRRRLGDNHPDYEAATADIKRLSAQIQQESSRVASSLRNATQINLRRESEVEEAFEAQKRRLLELKDQRDAAAVLQNDVVMAQRNLDAVATRQAQSNLESQTQQSNIVLLTPAVVPLSPSSPNKTHNLLLGAILGGLMGVASAMVLELIKLRVRSESDFVRTIQVPLIGRIAPDNPDGDTFAPGIG